MRAELAVCFEGVAFSMSDHTTTDISAGIKIARKICTTRSYVNIELVIYVLYVYYDMFIHLL